MKSRPMVYISLVFRTIDLVVDLNKRPGKTKPLGKSGIFHNWEKAQKDDTHRYSHTYMHIYVPAYHIPLDKVGFQVMGCTEGVLRSMKEFCLRHWGKWSRNIQKERKNFLHLFIWGIWNSAVRRRKEPCVQKVEWHVFHNMHSQEIRTFRNLIQH